jgi:protein-L-isoaspartate(D-aspartate) O-methyltransferase
MAVTEDVRGLEQHDRGAEALVKTAREVGVSDQRVLDAILTVPRADFVPPEQRERAYEDVPIPIPHDQVTTQPSLLAAMLEALELTGEENVLEVGTGYGWQTALLSRLARSVWSIERHHDLAEFAAAAVVRQDLAGVRIVVGDGSRGLPARSPYDAIVVAAAYPRVPNPLLRQLAPGGRLVQPIGEGGAEDVVLFRRDGSGLAPQRSVASANFVRLVGRHGFDDEV